MTTNVEQQLRIKLIEQQLINNYIYNQVFEMICVERRTIYTEDANIDDLSNEQIHEIFQERVINNLTKSDVAKNRSNFVVYPDQKFTPHRRFYEVTPLKLMIADIESFFKVNDIIEKQELNNMDFHYLITEWCTPYITDTSTEQELVEVMYFMADFNKNKNVSSPDDWTIDNCFDFGCYVPYPGNKEFNQYMEQKYINDSFIESMDKFDLLTLDPD